MRRIARSSAYQLSSRYDGEWKESYTPYFARHFVRQLTAEQLHDAISQATNVFGEYKRRDWLYETPITPVRFWTEAASPEDISNGQAGTFSEPLGSRIVSSLIANRYRIDSAGDDADEQPVRYASRGGHG